MLAVWKSFLGDLFRIAGARGGPQGKRRQNAEHHPTGERPRGLAVMPGQGAEDR